MEEIFLGVIQQAIEELVAEEIHIKTLKVIGSAEDLAKTLENLRIFRFRDLKLKCLLRGP